MPKRANRHDGSSRSTFALKYPRYPPMKLFNVPPNSRPAVSQQSRSRSFHLRYAFQNLTAPHALASVPAEGDAAEAKTFNPVTSSTLSTNRGMPTSTSDDVLGEASRGRRE